MCQQLQELQEELLLGVSNIDHVPQLHVLYLHGKPFWTGLLVA